MTEQWIAASTAVDIFKNRRAICERCHADLVRSSAQKLIVDKKEFVGIDLPKEFWWADGGAALDQNWTTGDFSTFIEGRQHWRAYGVTFALNDLLKMVPFEEHAAIRRKLSVAGDPAWLTAREARRFAYEKAGENPARAGLSIIAQCRVGMISARSVSATIKAGMEQTSQAAEMREWSIPIWFWRDFTIERASSQNWELGIFAGRGKGPHGINHVTLDGVHFLESSLAILLPRAARNEVDGSHAEPQMPNVSDADLKNWWKRVETVREKLTLDQLLTLARGEFTGKTIARERIRELGRGRAPGRKKK